LLNVVAPGACAACSTLAGEPLCATCRASLPPLTPARSLDGVPVLGSRHYGAPLDAIVHRLKYADRPDLAPALAALIAPELAALPAATLVPVPLHPRRLAERGYNQSALLCRALSPLLGARVGVDWLLRHRDGPRQAQSGSAAERADNVLGVFRACRPVGGRVILVDDVVTTGATARGCILALRSAGAQVVAVAAPCQVPRSGPSARPDC
jgi:ComF family protein